MAEKTIQIYSVDSIPIQRVADGTSLSGNNPITNSVWGDAFSWQNPSNVRLTFGTPNASISFNDNNSILEPNPVNGNTVIDQRLTQPTTINGQTFNPSPNDVLWQNPPAVFVRADYSVTLYDAQNKPYVMVGVSIVTGYSPLVVGVMFLGASPPPGTALFYKQGISTYDPSPYVPLQEICFAAESLILTEKGLVPVGDLQPGMRVQTRDHGLQTVRWTGWRDMTAIDLMAFGYLRPIRIQRGALGQGLPVRDLVVSPQHRILLRSKIAQRLGGHIAMLVAAKHLLGMTGIEIADDLETVRYVHFMLDHHEIVFVEGIETESLLPGPEAMKTLLPAARAELLTIFPELEGKDTLSVPARPILCGRQARKLVERHLRNDKPLLQTPLEAGFEQAEIRE